EGRLGGGEVGHASGLAAGHDRHLVGPVGVGLHEGTHGVARLVVGNDEAILVGGDGGAPFEPENDAVEGCLEVDVGDVAVGGARREHGRLVDQALEVGTGEADRAGGERRHVDVVGGGHSLQVDVEDALPAGAIGEADMDVAGE